MNEKVNNFLLVGDKFMPEMHLKQARFTYSTDGPFIKNKERNQKFKETEDSRYIYKNEFDKSCFQHYMTNGYFKDLAKRTASDKVLTDKVFNIAKNLKDEGYHRGLASLVYIFLIQSLQAVVFFFLSGFSFTTIHEPQDCRGRGRAFL